MTRRQKSGFSSKIVEWVHSGRESDSGKSWVMPGERASVYIGPLLGLSEIDGRTVPVLNLDREGYWGRYSIRNEESELHRCPTLREAIHAAFSEAEHLAELGRLEEKTRPKVQRERKRKRQAKGRSLPQDEYWAKRRLHERMSQTPLSSAYKSSKGIESGFTLADFSDRG